jgi:hypothetical protein
MLTNPKLGASVADDTIMFGELSSEKRLLDFAGVSHPSEKFWDVLPVAYIYQNKAQMSQEEIDDEALLQLRVI